MHYYLHIKYFLITITEIINNYETFYYIVHNYYFLMYNVFFHLLYVLQLENVFYISSGIKTTFL